MIKMSVIVPTHGRVELFKETLKSLECQTTNDFEIIVTDDSNFEYERDEIKILIKNFKRKNINIKYVFTKANLYQAKNTNQGLKFANGKYIRILHSDDIIANNCIEEEIKLFEKYNDIDIFYSHKINFINTEDIIFDNKYIKLNIISPKIWLQSTIFTNTIIPSCICFRKSLLNKVVGLYENYNFLCDWKLFFDLLIISYKEDKKIGCIQSQFIGWRVHNNNISSNLIFEHFLEHKDFIKNVQKIYKELNIINNKELLDNNI